MKKIMNHLSHGLKNSLHGLKRTWQTQFAFRLEMFFFIIALPLAVWIERNILEFIVLMSSMFLLLLAELLNSAIETVIDRIGLEYHKLSGLAKDVASAAVFLAICNAIFVWLCIIVSHMVR